MLTELEQGRFSQLLSYLHNHPRASYTLVLPSESVDAEYETDFESDNGLDEDNPGYEEYQSIVFKRKDNGILFEINYHNIPEQIYSNNTLIV